MSLAIGFWLSQDFKTIAAGVAIFLFGMLSLEQGFKSFTGGVLEKFLQKTTNKLWKSLTFGFVSTTLMQSSSLVSVITITFISAGLIELLQGVGIIFGANLGTTTGAWLVAGLGMKVKISAYAMPMLVFGVILQFQTNRTYKGVGYILLGLGFLFLGIHYMKEGFETFKEAFDMTTLALDGYAGLFVYSMVGILATVVMQSSHATLVLTITALAAQQISYENALALAIGANVGTTITAVLGSISANVAGKRLAGAHLIFNLVTGLIAISFIFVLADIVDWISLRIGIASDNYTLKLAVFHTVFNLIGVAVMLPFIKPMVSMLERTLKEKKEPTRVSVPRYLNDASLALPDAALEALRRETRRLADKSFEIIAHSINLHRRDILSNKSIESIVADSNHPMLIDIDDLYQRRIKPIYSAIVEFSSHAQANMEPEQVDHLYRLKIANRDLVEAIKEMMSLQTNMSRYIDGRNIYMQQEYNVIRRNLGELLRTIFSIEEVDDPSAVRKALKGCKLAMRTDDILANGTLDKLIRDNLISDQMATSLMNDSAYAYNIHKNLIKASREILGVRKAPKVEAVEKDLQEDDADIEQILDQNQQRIEDMLQKNRNEVEALLRTKHMRSGAS